MTLADLFSRQSVSLSLDTAGVHRPVRRGGFVSMAKESHRGLIVRTLYRPTGGWIELAASWVSFRLTAMLHKAN